MHILGVLRMIMKVVVLVWMPMGVPGRGVIVHMLMSLRMGMIVAVSERAVVMMMSVGVRVTHQATPQHVEAEKSNG